MDQIYRVRKDTGIQATDQGSLIIPSLASEGLLKIYKQLASAYLLLKDT